MEQNKEMTAQQSLQIISETIGKNRREILRSSGKHLIFWGALLTVFSVCIYLLWSCTGNGAWNFLWFAMPLIGLPLGWLTGRKSVPVPDNFLSKILGGVWSAYGVFATCAAALACSVVPFNITVTIVLLFGFAESVSGIILKNWAVIVSGFVLALGGMFIGIKFADSPAQLLIFTLGGVVLAATGLIVKSQNK